MTRTTNEPTDDGMFLVEGVLAEVNVERGRENLLARIDKHYKSKAMLKAVALGESISR